MKHLFKISTAVLASALLLSTTAMAANYWTDDVVVEAGKGTPTIDGVYDAAEWSTAQEVAVTMDDPVVNQYGEYQGGWADERNPADFSTWVRFIWDEEALYIVEQRFDDYIELGGTGATPWGGSDAWIRINDGSTNTQETVQYDGIQIASAPAADGFCIEVKVPWSVFANEIPSFVPGENVQIGMSMVPIDFDQDGEFAQLSWFKQADQLGVPGGYDYGG